MCWIIGSLILAIPIYPFNEMVCDGIFSTVGCYIGDLWSIHWLGTQ